MVTAWEKLKSISALDTGTAWELLNNPGSGSGGSLVLLDGLEIEMEDNFDVLVDNPELQVEIEEDMTIEVETTDYQIEV